MICSMFMPVIMLSSLFVLYRNLWHAVVSRQIVRCALLSFREQALTYETAPGQVLQLAVHLENDPWSTRGSILSCQRPNPVAILPAAFQSLRSLAIRTDPPPQESGLSPAEGQDPFHNYRPDISDRKTNCRAP